jgi:dTDP-4-dehydrorhamnose reductase
MDKILVIGSSGLVGGRLMELGDGLYEMFGTCNSHEQKLDNVSKLDVRDRNDVFNLMEKIKPDCVIDTHSLSNVDYCETHAVEAWQVNVEGSKNIAEACRNFGCKYIFMSTDYVFDGRKKEYTEKDKPRPLSYYAKTKFIAEQMLYALDLNYAVVRPAVIYGKGGMNKVSFPMWLMNELRAGRSARIVTDQYENPTFADVLVKQMFGLYERDETGLFNATGSNCLSRMEFALEIASVFGLDKDLLQPVTTPELNQIAHRPVRVNLVTDKIEKATGVKSLATTEGLLELKAQIGE